MRAIVIWLLLLVLAIAGAGVWRQAEWMNLPRVGVWMESEFPPAQSPSLQTIYVVDPVLKWRSYSQHDQMEIPSMVLSKKPVASSFPTSVPIPQANERGIAAIVAGVFAGYQSRGATSLPGARGDQEDPPSEDLLAQFDSKLIALEDRSFYRENILRILRQQAGFPEGDYTGAIAHRAWLPDTSFTRPQSLVLRTFVAWSKPKTFSEGTGYLFNLHLDGRDTFWIAPSQGKGTEGRAAEFAFRLPILPPHSIALMEQHEAKLWRSYHSLDPVTHYGFRGGVIFAVLLAIRYRASLVNLVRRSAAKSAAVASTSSRAIDEMDRKLRQ